MKIEEYKKTLKHTVRERTLAFLINNGQVILGYKKKGFGKGKILGIGGKVELGETKESATKREVEEEININIKSLEYRGFVNFYFPHIEDESWNQKVHVFVSKDWEGIPTETDEIKPIIIDIDKVPYDKMWDDNKLWLPKVLKGESVKMEFVFDKELNVIEFEKILE